MSTQSTPTLHKIPLSDPISQEWLKQWADAVYMGEEHPSLEGYAIPTGVAMQFLLSQFPTRLQDMHKMADVEEFDAFVPTALLARAYRGILLLDKQQEESQFDSNAIQRTWAHIQKPYLEDWKKYGNSNRPILWQSQFGSLIDVELTKEDFQELKALFKNDGVDKAWLYVYETAAMTLFQEMYDNPREYLENMTASTYEQLLKSAYIDARQCIIDSWKTDSPLEVVFPEDFSLACDTPESSKLTLSRDIALAQVMPVVSDENEKFHLALTKYLMDMSKHIQADLGKKYKTDFKIKVELQNIAITFQDKIKKLAKPWYWEGAKEESLEKQAELWAWTTSWANVDKWEPLLNNMSIFPGVEEIGTLGYTGKDEYWWTSTPFAEKYKAALEWIGPARETLKEQQDVNYLDDFFALTGAR